MFGEARLRDIADRVLKRASADQTEVLISSEESHLTRFAESSIHQNVTERNAGVRVRSILGKKTGAASGNDTSDEGLARLVRAAEQAASFQKDDPEFQSLPSPQPIVAVDAYSEATAAFTPEERAEGVKRIIDRAQQNGLRAAGSFSTVADEVLIANSLGIRAYASSTVANVRTVVMGEDSSGYGAHTDRDVTQLDPDAVGREAVEKALRSRAPSGIEPGPYTVILEEEAVADMMRSLAFMGLGALAFQENRSFMSGRLGERITGENITIWDDGHDLRGVPLPFDFEGVPKQKVMLIEKGVARNVVYDSYTAGREANRQSTGHALPSPSMMGPIPLHVFMGPGTATKEEMVAATERGIWVTRFHYTNPLHPVKTVLTGMTRDGTFWIENGKITRPLKNLRFTQSILEAFGNADMLGSTLTAVKSLYGTFVSCVPAMRIQGFRFTGATEF